MRYSVDTMPCMLTLVLKLDQHLVYVDVKWSTNGSPSRVMTATIPPPAVGVCIVCSAPLLVPLHVLHVDLAVARCKTIRSKKKKWPGHRDLLLEEPNL